MDKEALKRALFSGDMKPATGGDEETILLLWALAEDMGEQKAIRKKAKRALYLLRSKGIDVDGVKPERLRKPSLTDTKKRVETAALSLPDSGLQSVISIAASDTKTLGFDAHDFLISVSFGITGHRVRHAAKRSLARALINGQEGKTEFFEVPGEYALYRLRRAVSLSPEEEREALAARIDGFTASDTGTTEPEHPLSSLLSPRVSHIAAPDEEKTLFSEREIARIMLPDESTREFRSLIEEAKNSRLILENRTPKQRVSEAVSRFCAFYFSPPRRFAFRDILLDVALHYFRHEREGYARILQSYAEGFLNPALDIRQHPFVQYLTYKAFLMKG
ncbi:MAG: hypothetical protein JXQ30_10635 [Spirochaetes bacterium]|nr:hypothetical protein [Spirochaetota bacterium]